MAVTRDQVAKLYVANFNRAPDAAGLDYWISDGTSATTTLTDLNEIAASMQAGAEASTGVASMTDSAYVVSLYSSMFGRTVAADSADVTYWTAQITAGSVTRANMIQTLILGAEASTGSATDAAVLANKTTVGLAYADAGLNGTFSVATVTDDVATVTAAETSIDNLTPVTRALTTAADTITTNNGNDTITADILTLTATDSVVDSSTTDSDTMNITLNADVASTVTITKVENINLSGLGDRTVDMTHITGVDTFTTTGSTGTVTLNNVSEATMALGFAGSSTNTIDANYSAGALSGTADTANIIVTSAKGVTATTDAGFESATMTVNGTGNTITDINVSGVTTLTLAGTGAMTLADAALEGFTTVNITNTAAITTGAMGATTKIATINAVNNTGGLVDADLNATTGLATNTISLVTTGGTVITGSGADNLNITDNATSGSNTVKLGAGNDKLVFVNNAGVGASYIFGEAGDDAVTVTTAALVSTDVVNLGEGTDTLNLDGTLANNAMVLRGVENVNITGTGNTQTFTNADQATAIVFKAAAANDVALANLYAGSTVAINELVAGAAPTIDLVTVGFNATEASTTIDINVAMDESLTVSKVTALTLDFAKATTIAGGQDLTIDDTTSLTIVAAAALDLGDGITSAATDALTTISATGSAAIDLGTNLLNSDALTTLTVSGTVTTVGEIVAADDLSSVSVTATTGAADVGAIGTTTTVTNLATMTVAGATAATIDEINATDIGTISATATNGALTVAEITVTDEIGTITLTSTNGAVNLGDGTVGIAAADENGMTISITAKTFISDDGADVSDDALITNDGDITATLAGAAAANVNYTVSGTNDGSVNLNASGLTGGLISTITNDEDTALTGTSTISLGALSASTVNSLTLAGYTGATTVTGSIGADTIVNSAGGAALNITNSNDSYNGSTGTDTISYDGSTHDAASGTNGAGATTDGYAMNFTSSTITFHEGSTYTNTTTLAAGVVAQYDSTATASTSATAGAIVAGGETDNVSGFEKVIGSAKADYIAVANTGMTVTGGDSADTIVLNAGVDTIAYAAAADLAAIDTVSNFTVGTDKIQIAGSLMGDGNTTKTFQSAATITAGGNAEINIVTTALANDAAIIAAIQGSTDATGSIFVVYNTAAAATQIWYDLNPNVNGAETQFATLVGITDAGMDALVTGDFLFV